MFIRLNWLCALGAHVLVGVHWREQISGNVPLARHAFIDYLEAAGFRVEKCIATAQDVDTPEEFQNDLQEEWYFQVTPITRMIDRYPRPHYNGEYSVAFLITENNLRDMINIPRQLEVAG